MATWIFHLTGKKNHWDGSRQASMNSICYKTYFLLRWYNAPLYHFCGIPWYSCAVFMLMHWTRSATGYQIDIIPRQCRTYTVHPDPTVMSDHTWSFNVLSININGMSSRLWERLGYLTISKQHVVLIPETIVYDTEQQPKLQFIWETETNRATCFNLVAETAFGGATIFLSIIATSLITEARSQNHGHVHKVIHLSR